VDYPCLNFLFIINEEYMDVNERGKSLQKNITVMEQIFDCISLKCLGYGV